MIVIVEGIDRVGKTTLCNQISKQFDIPIYKKLREGGNDNDIDKNGLINFGNILGHVSVWQHEAYKDVDIIIDRFHWTEFVYNVCARNQFVPQILNVDKVISKMKNVHMVYVKPMDITMSSKQHGENLEEYDRIFDIVYEVYKGNKIKVDYSTLDEAMRYVGENIIKEKRG